MLDWFSNAITSVNATRQIANSLITLRDAELVRSQVFELTNNLMDLQQQLMNAQTQQMELIAKAQNLQKLLDAATKAADISNRYCRYSFPDGSFAYTVKPEIRGEEPVHFLCSNCFEKGEVATLNAEDSPGVKCLRCPRCRTFVHREVKSFEPHQMASFWADK